MSRVTLDPDTIERLDALLRREIGAAAAIDRAARHEAHPGDDYFLREAKAAHQTSVGQLSTLIAAAGGEASTRAPGVAVPLELQALATQLTAGTTLTLRAMRVVVQSQHAEYAALAPALSGIAGRTVEMLRRRANAMRHLLTAHIARRSSDPAEEAAHLPLPLGRYFAGREALVCMRCLVDRPGERPALRRESPHTYLCAGCHDDVHASVPPDLRAPMNAWPERIREDRTIERGLSRPSKQTAQKTVHATLAGEVPEPVVPASLSTDEPPQAREPQRHVEGEQPAATLLLHLDGVAEPERAYVTKLFDFRSVRRSW